MSALYYDPYDYAIDVDPHPVWRRMRDEAPLYRNERHDFYALSRFEDVLAASVDARTFSSAWGTVLDLMSDVPDQSPMMIFRDPPEHTRLRKLVSRAFSPRRIEELEPHIRNIARELLEPLRDRKSFDYVADFGAILPSMVISSMLGFPREDWQQIREWTESLLHREEGGGDATAHHESLQAQLWEYFAGYVTERRKRPRDDMMNDLLDSEMEGEEGSRRKLSDTELLAFIGLLSGAGNETVARLVGWTGATLARFPAERRKLVEAPARIPRAVEELLRYEAPSPVQVRTLTRDVELHGARVPVGSRVLLLTGSAGRDGREYPEPDRFDIERVFERHISLGFGVHFCLGASLARMEGRIALEETLQRFPEWEVRWEETERVHTSTVRGYAKLPIHV